MLENKPKLDFLGIGFTKAGSTWIYKCLEDHPEICMPKIKETDFFINQDLEERPDNLKLYKEFFSGCSDKQIRGEFSPMYVAKDKALKNIKNFYPNIKLLAVLRNPVDRVISNEMYRYKFVPNVDFNNIDKAIFNKFKDSDSKQDYYRYLKKWYDNFPADNIYVMILEEMEKEPRQELSKLYRFLGIDTSFCPDSAFQKFNVAHSFKMPRLQKILRKFYRNIKKHPRISGFFVNTPLSSKLKNIFLKINKKEHKKPAISSKTRGLLHDIHKEEIEKLEVLLSRNLSAWK